MRPRLTYANVVSTICLFLLLGGGAAFAATKLAKNSVGTKQIKNGAVTGAKVKADSLTGANIEESTLATVPSATSATSATSALTADRATSAGTAGTASVASGLGPLPSGHSESGGWATSGASGGFAAVTINFTIPLASVLSSAHTIYVSGGSAAHCDGVGQADPGYLCVYQVQTSSATFDGLLGFIAPGPDTAGASASGTVFFEDTSSSLSFAYGEWTVTAA